MARARATKPTLATAAAVGVLLLGLASRCAAFVALGSDAGDGEVLDTNVSSTNATNATDATPGEDGWTLPDWARQELDEPVFGQTLHFLDIDFDVETTRLAPGFCSAASANVCAYQNAMVLAKRTRHAMQAIGGFGDFTKLSNEFADNSLGKFSENEFFSVRICAEDGSCVLNGNQAAGLPGSPSSLQGTGTTWREHVDTLFTIPPVTERLNGTYNWAPEDGNETYSKLLNFVPFDQMIHNEAMRIARTGGGWMRLPYMSCEKLAYSRSTALCQMAENRLVEDDGLLKLPAVMFITPVAKGTVPSFFNFPRNTDATKMDYYVASAIIDSMPHLSDSRCSNLYSNLCATQFVQWLVSKAFRAVTTATSWPMLETTLNEINYNAEYKLVYEGSDSFYVYVGDYEDILVAHGANAKLVGRGFDDIIPPMPNNFGYSGEWLHQSFVNATRQSNTGWASYNWPTSSCQGTGDTTSCGTQPKVAYLARVNLFGRDMYIGCGYTHDRQKPQVLIDEEPCKTSFALSCATFNMRLVGGHTLSAVYWKQGAIEEIAKLINEDDPEYSVNKGTDDKFFVMIVQIASGTIIAYNGNDENVKVSMTFEDIWGAHGKAMFEKMATISARGGGYLNYFDAYGRWSLALIVSYYHEPSSKSYFIQSSVVLDRMQHISGEDNKPCNMYFDMYCSRMNTIADAGWYEHMFIRAGRNESIQATYDVLREMNAIANERQRALGAENGASNGVDSTTKLLVFDDEGVLRASTDPKYVKYAQGYDDAGRLDPRSAIALQKIISQEGINGVSADTLFENFNPQSGGGWSVDEWIDDNNNEIQYNFFTGNYICRETGDFECVYVVGLVPVRDPNPPPFTVLLPSDLPAGYVNVSASAPLSSATVTGTGFIQSVLTSLRNPQAIDKSNKDGFEFQFMSVPAMNRTMQELSDSICTEVVTKSRYLGIAMVQRREHPVSCYGDGSHLIQLREIYLESLVLLTRTKEYNPSDKNPMRFFASLVQYDSILMMCIIFILMAITAVIIWIVERGVNTTQFPRGFLDGIDDAMWWCIVTATTVGYGDKVPVSNMGRMVGAAWMMLGLFFWSLFTAQVTYQLEVRNLPMSELKDAGYEKSIAASAAIQTPVLDEMSMRIGSTSKFRICPDTDECAEELRQHKLDGLVMTMNEAVMFTERDVLSHDLMFVGDVFQKGNVHKLIIMTSKNANPDLSAAISALSDQLIASLQERFFSRLKLASELAWTVPEPEETWPRIVQYMTLSVILLYSVANFAIWMFALETGLFWREGEKVLPPHRFKQIAKRIIKMLEAIERTKTYAEKTRRRLFPPRTPPMTPESGATSPSPIPPVPQIAYDMPPAVTLQPAPTSAPKADAYDNSKVHPAPPDKAAGKA